MPSYRVIIEWKDNDVEDADEMQVIARSPPFALKAARRRWDTQFGAKYPECRATRLFVLTDEEMSAI